MLPAGALVQLEFLFGAEHREKGRFIDPASSLPLRSGARVPARLAAAVFLCSTRSKVFGSECVPVFALFLPANV